MNLGHLFLLVKMWLPEKLKWHVAHIGGLTFISVGRHCWKRQRAGRPTDIIHQVRFLGPGQRGWARSEGGSEEENTRYWTQVLLCARNGFRGWGIKQQKIQLRDGSAWEWEQWGWGEKNRFKKYLEGKTDGTWKLDWEREESHVCRLSWVNSDAIFRAWNSYEKRVWCARGETVSILEMTSLFVKPGCMYRTRA